MVLSSSRGAKSTPRGSLGEILNSKRDTFMVSAPTVFTEVNCLDQYWEDRNSGSLSVEYQKSAFEGPAFFYPMAVAQVEHLLSML